MIQIEYTPSFRDYWALNLHAMRRGRGIMLFWIAVLSLGYYILYPLIHGPLLNDKRSALEFYRESLGVLILPGVVALVVAATFVGARQRWSAALELHEEKRYELDEEGIRLKSKSVNAFTEWAIFKKYWITKRFAYIMTAQQQYHYFPLSSVSDVPALVSLLKRKIIASK